MTTMDSVFTVEVVSTQNGELLFRKPITLAQAIALLGLKEQDLVNISSPYELDVLKLTAANEVAWQAATEGDLKDTSQGERIKNYLSEIKKVEDYCLSKRQAEADLDIERGIIPLDEDDMNRLGEILESYHLAVQIVE